VCPDAFHSNADFDRASRAELLVFGHELASTEILDDDVWRARLHLKTIDHAHLLQMRDIYWQRAVHNYALASAHRAMLEPFCQPAADRKTFKSISGNFNAPKGARYAPWYVNATKFHRIYLDEELRAFPVCQQRSRYLQSQRIQRQRIARSTIFPELR